MKLDRAVEVLVGVVIFALLTLPGCDMFSSQTIIVGQTQGGGPNSPNSITT